MNNNLPFERGTTYFEGDTNRINTASILDDMLGQCFTVKNNGSAPFAGHNSQENTLMVVRNSSGGTLTPKLGVQYGTNMCKEVTAHASAGNFGHIIDDAYGTDTIADDDIFYVVVDGPVQGLSLTAATYVIGEAMVFGAGGRLIGQSHAATGVALSHVVGTSFQALATAAQDTTVIVGTGGRYSNGGPAVVA